MPSGGVSGIGGGAFGRYLDDGDMHPYTAIGWYIRLRALRQPHRRQGGQP